MPTSADARCWRDADICRSMRLGSGHAAIPSTRRLALPENLWNGSSAVVESWCETIQLGTCQRVPQVEAFPVGLADVKMTL